VLDRQASGQETSGEEGDAREEIRHCAEEIRQRAEEAREEEGDEEAALASLGPEA
jgi:hypothetical protein